MARLTEMLRIFPCLSSFSGWQVVEPGKHDHNEGGSSQYQEPGPETSLGGSSHASKSSVRVNDVQGVDSVDSVCGASRMKSMKCSRSIEAGPCSNYNHWMGVSSS